MKETEVSRRNRQPFYYEFISYHRHQELMRAIFGEKNGQFLFCHPSIMEEDEEITLRDGIIMALNTLPNFPLSPWTKQNQIKLVNLRFGLKDGEARTLKEVGKEFSVTAERIRVVEKRILWLLQRPNRSSFLKKFLISTQETKIEELSKQGAL